MAIITAVVLGLSLGSTMSILYVALGLGLVIFFHEMGHFAVAKWCDVQVERFSIGFGPILKSFKWGETEYALSAIPFGGYVKMLGQDDMDPSQLTSEEIALDPRSYSAKSVPQRMAIISAGVIMNILTAGLFFAIGFLAGVRSAPAVVGTVVPGSPAWQVGIEPGDTITQIDDRNIETFSDMMRGVALSTGPITVQGVKRDGSKFKVTVTPDGSGTRRVLGIGQSSSLRFWSYGREEYRPTEPNTPARSVKKSFRTDDVVTAIDGQAVSSHTELDQLLHEKRNQDELEVTVKRGEKSVDIPIQKRNPYRVLGINVEIGAIEAIRAESPAANAKLKTGDKIIEFQGEEVGTEVDPMQLPELFARLHGQPVQIVVQRNKETIPVTLIPEDVPLTQAHPTGENVPLAIPSIGVAYHLVPVVLNVEKDSPAEKAGIKKGERIRKFALVLPKKSEATLYGEDPIEFEFSEEQKNYAIAFWMMQLQRQRNVKLVIENAEGKSRTETLKPHLAEDWNLADRGFRLRPSEVTLQADGPIDALAMGYQHTKNTTIDMYLTLRNLFSRDLSVKNLHGPIGIARVAYEVAEQGTPELMLFLGILSVNLAVINFLPIPVLDGGHMVFLIWEAVTRKRPSEKVQIAATYVGMAFILGLMVFVIWLDIFEHNLFSG